MPDAGQHEQPRPRDRGRRPAASRGETSRSRSPQTTSVGACTRGRRRPRRRPPPPARHHRPRRPLPASWAQASPLRTAISSAASTSRCSGTRDGSPKHTRTTCSARHAGRDGGEPGPGALPDPAGISASASRMSAIRRGSGRRSGIAGETSVRVRTSSGRRAATLSATAPPSELPSRCTGSLRPARKQSRASACAAGVKSNPAGGRVRPNPGRSTAVPAARVPSRAARSVQFCRRAAEAVDVDGPASRRVPASRGRAGSPRRRRPRGRARAGGAGRAPGTRRDPRAAAACRADRWAAPVGQVQRRAPGSRRERARPGAIGRCGTRDGTTTDIAPSIADPPPRHVRRASRATFAAARVARLRRRDVRDLCRRESARSPARVATSPGRIRPAALRTQADERAPTRGARGRPRSRRSRAARPAATARPAAGVPSPRPARPR